MPVLSGLAMALAISLLPVLSTLANRQSADGFWRVYEQGFAVLTFLFVPVGFFLTLYAGDLIGAIYGSQYQQAPQALRLLVWAQMFAGIGLVYSWAHGFREAAADPAARRIVGGSEHRTESHPDPTVWHRRCSRGYDRILWDRHDVAVRHADHASLHHATVQSQRRSCAGFARIRRLLTIRPMELVARDAVVWRCVRDQHGDSPRLPASASPHIRIGLAATIKAGRQAPPSNEGQDCYWGLSFDMRRCAPL